MIYFSNISLAFMGLTIRQTLLCEWKPAVLCEGWLYVFHGHKVYLQTSD